MNDGNDGKRYVRRRTGLLFNAPPSGYKTRGAVYSPYGTAPAVCCYGGGGNITPRAVIYDDL